jgi:hypothetical protein
MPPADVFLEQDWEIEVFDRREMWEEDQPLTAGEDWDSELLVPAQGRLLYVGQGQSRYTFFHHSTPSLLWPKKKRRKRKKKTASPQPPPPPPEPTPVPPATIDWDDWEETCQTVPPTPAQAPVGEDWDAEIAASQDKEDWDAEIAASQ